VAPLAAALQRVPGEDRLAVLSSGPLPPNPSELLSSSRTTELLAALASQFDTVLVDCPPVLPVTDAAVLSGRVDGTLIVVSARATTRKDLRRAVSALRQVGAPLIGTVLNGSAPEGRYAYQYGAYQPERRPKVAAAGNGNGNRNGNGKLTAKDGREGKGKRPAPTGETRPPRSSAS
jgi:Mrp family chromosome partitioning ATPase